MIRDILTSTPALHKSLLISKLAEKSLESISKFKNVWEEIYIIYKAECRQTIILHINLFNKIFQNNIRLCLQKL